MKSGYFITGTDTGVGKTLIASALIYKFAQSGLKSVGMKPVAAGCVLVSGQLISEDVTKLIAASNVTAPLEQINPYAFAGAYAPHIGAKEANIEIKQAVIQSAFEALGKQADVIVVEGVGGFCVPLGDNLNAADLVALLNIPIILVVGMRLGCLSHALLTVEAIEVRGLKLAGWVANAIDPTMVMFDENLLSLKEQIKAPCLGVVPWQMDAHFERVADCLSLE
jgi:dethiobiotin synthetase